MKWAALCATLLVACSYPRLDVVGRACESSVGCPDDLVCVVASGSSSGCCERAAPDGDSNAAGDDDATPTCSVLSCCEADETCIGVTEETYTCLSCCSSGCQSDTFVTFAYPVGTVVIDGNLDETQALERVSVVNANVYGAVWFGWNGDGLYIAAQVADTRLNAVTTIRDGDVYRDDGIELFFDPEHNRGTAQLPDATDFKLLVNLLNTQRDDGGAGAWESWNRTWSSIAVTDGTLGDDSDVDRGYILELSIPWAEIPGGFPGDGGYWAADFGFTNRDTTGQTTPLHAYWHNDTGGLPNDPDGWGKLQFME